MSTLDEWLFEMNTSFSEDEIFEKLKKRLTKNYGLENKTAAHIALDFLDTLETLEYCSSPSHKYYIH
ncbi:MAG: hypothetical protein ACI9QD_001081 [Thermoproteota archaeon]|jgi:hypothetical protein